MGLWLKDCLGVFANGFGIVVVVIGIGLGVVGFEDGSASGLARKAATTTCHAAGLAGIYGLKQCDTAPSAAPASGSSGKDRLGFRDAR